MNSRSLNRRTLLTSTPALALAVAAPAAAVAASLPLTVNVDSDTALFGLLHEYEAASASLKKAKDDLDWIVAEWRHLWPLAPEEILGVANGERSDSAERDLAGNFMMRECGPLTKRLAPKFRKDWHRTTCFSVETSEEITERLEWLRADEPTGRTAKSLARNTARRAASIKHWQEKLPLARHYETETARIREASGANAARQDIEAKRAVATALADKIMEHPANTLDGIAAKASFFVAYPRAIRFKDCFTGCGIYAFGWSLADDIKRVCGGLGV